jgi:hypothetical protein
LRRFDTFGGSSQQSHWLLKLPTGLSTSIIDQTLACATLRFELVDQAGYPVNAGAREGHPGKKMGIKFLCPNGHKLNVKSFLSGKKAICPMCGARVIVPSEGPADPSDESSAAESTADIASPAIEQPLDQVAGLKTPAAPSNSAATPPLPPTLADPIGDSPTAVWYVRPATGGQFGPASGEIMRDWLAQGRVGASSLVWRAGWPDWRTAAAIFPQLGGLPAPGLALASGVMQVASAGAASFPNGAVPTVPVLPVGHLVPGAAGQNGPGSLTSVHQAALPPLAQSMKRRRRQNDLSLIFSAVLGVVAIILLIVLFLLFRKQSASDESPGKDLNPSGEVSLI